MVIDEGVAIHDTCAYLGTELHVGTSLATYYGTDMRLKNTDNAVRTLMDTRSMHLVLLVHHLYDGGDDLLLIEEQEIIAFVVYGKDVQQLTQVLCQAVKQVGDGVLHQAALLNLLFDEQQIGTAGILIVGRLPLDAKLFAYLGGVLVYLAVCRHESADISAR